MIPSRSQRPRRIRTQSVHRFRTVVAVADDTSEIGMSPATVPGGKNKPWSMRERGTECQASSPTSAHRPTPASLNSH